MKIKEKLSESNFSSQFPNVLQRNSSLLSFSKEGSVERSANHSRNQSQYLSTKYKDNMMKFPQLKHINKSINSLKDLGINIIE